MSLLGKQSIHHRDYSEWPANIDRQGSLSHNTLRLSLQIWHQNYSKNQLTTKCPQPSSNYQKVGLKDDSSGLELRMGLSLQERSSWGKICKKSGAANRISSCCRIKSTLYFLQWASLSFHNVTSYVEDSEQAHGWESQVHWADPKLIHNAQEPEANHKVGYLIKYRKKRG